VAARATPAFSFRARIPGLSVPPAASAPLRTPSRLPRGGRAGRRGDRRLAALRLRKSASRGGRGARRGGAGSPLLRRALGRAEDGFGLGQLFGEGGSMARVRKALAALLALVLPDL
jgi:hypothetical protein